MGLLIARVRSIVRAAPPRYAGAAMLVALILAPIAHAQSEYIVAKPAKVDFGDVAPGVPVTKTVTLDNIGNFPLHIRSVRPSCQCTVADVPKDAEILPGQSLDFKMTFTGTTREGPASPSVMVVFIEAIPPIRIESTANVNRGIRFQITNTSTDGAEAAPVVHLESAHARPFRILSIDGRPPEDLAASQPATSHDVPLESLPAGAESFPGAARWVVFETDDPDSPVVATPAQSAEHDSTPRPWTISEPIHVLGPLAPSDEHVFEVILTGLRGEPLDAIERIDLDTHGAQAGLLGIERAPQGMNARLFARPAPGATGLIGATIRITASDHTEAIDVYAEATGANSGEP